MVAEALIHRFDIATYHRLISDGILRENDRVELIYGRLVNKTPIGSRHSAVVNRFNNLLTQKVKGRAIVGVQDPIKLIQEQSEPEPDITLLKFREDFYSSDLPKGEDVLLVIEVADTSLDYDRDTKIPMYAQAKIQEVWIVNLLENCIEIYSSPSSSGYEFRRTVREGQSVSPKEFPDISLTANQILGI